MNEMLRLSGTEQRLDYIEAKVGPEVAAVAQEVVRLSRLADYESPYDHRNWGSESHACIATATVDAILKDVFQGRRDKLRGQMLDVAAKTDRRMMPWWEERIQAALTAAEGGAGDGVVASGEGGK